LTEEEYYDNLDFYSLSTLIKELGIEKTQNILNTFKCNRNEDLQDFLHNPNKAIKLENQNITRTYLYFETKDTIVTTVAYFTISLKVLSTEGLSKTLVKKLDGIDKHRDSIPCYLIAQLGKHSSLIEKIGKYLLDDAIETIKDANHVVGGRFIILDAVNKKKIIEFYQKEPNSFISLKSINTDDENIQMYYPLI